MTIIYGLVILLIGCSSRKKALLSYFGSFKAIREASVEELRKVPGVGPALAFKIHEALKLGR